MMVVKLHLQMYYVSAHNIDANMNAYPMLRSIPVCLVLMGSAAELQAQSKVVQDESMVLIPAGIYSPLYKNEGDSGRVQVSSFYMDVHPVTNAEFLAFVTANPKWRRSQVKQIFADQTYLNHWAGDLDIGGHEVHAEKRPVTNVSWFAARAYAKWKGKRLPTLAEWEYTASASRERPNGADEPGFNDRILQWYSQPSPDMLPFVGARDANYWGIHDLHGLVWEWVNDFNSALITGESRGDSGLERKLYCGSGSIGSSDVSNYAAFMRYAFRSSLKAQYAVSNLGFRCAKDGAGL